MPACWPTHRLCHHLDAKPITTVYQVHHSTAVPLPGSRHIYRDNLHSGDLAKSMLIPITGQIIQQLGLFICGSPTPSGAC
jgi:hypothetical protein